MGERKGQNKYYPPDFDWRKHSSLNAYQGVHALRERARKLDRGILIIRFEMPYNIWCNTCGNHIGMGVRYNAEKTTIGKYFTTPILQFRMKCHLCDGHFEIKTDPKARDYVIVSGARREEQRWDASENGQIVMESKEEMKKLATDAMFKLEYEGKDVAKKANKSAPDLTELEIQQSAWKDDYIINYVLRKNLRETKREDRLQKEADDRVRKKASIDIPLLPSSRQDDRLAKLYRSEPLRSAEQTEVDRREVIDQQQISMSSNASSSGIESDSDSSPSLNEEKNNNSSMSDITNLNNESIDTLVNDDEDFIDMDFDTNKSKVIPEKLTHCDKNLHHEQIISTPSKSIYNKPSYPSYSKNNPYDDDTSTSSVVEDWDEECKVIEPYYFPGYIRRAQWPNHWRWTPPLGFRRTCTQQLHRNLGFEPTGLYDDTDHFRRFKFDFH